MSKSILELNGQRPPGIRRESRRMFFPVHLLAWKRCSALHQSSSHTPDKIIHLWQSLCIILRWLNISDRRYDPLYIHCLIEDTHGRLIHLLDEFTVSFADPAVVEQLLWLKSRLYPIAFFVVLYLTRCWTSLHTMIPASSSCSDELRRGPWVCFSVGMF